MTELEIFMAGGTVALLTWAVGLIAHMIKAGASDNTDF